MEFGLSQEQVLLQDSINRFLTDEAPLAVVREVAAGDRSDAEIWKGLINLGIGGLLTSEANGGLGLGYLDAALVAECLGYHVTPCPYLSSAVIAPATLQLAGQREYLLGGVATGDRRIGIAFGEGLGARADAGIEVAGASTAGASCKINGKSLFALDDAADAYLVTTQGKQILLVDAKTKGLTRKALQTIDKTRTTCELAFKKVEAELIADEPEIFEQAMDLAAVALAADTLGAAQCALDQAVAYAKQREQFNRVIASFQAVKHLCAEMASSLEPCRSMVWYAAHALAEIPDEARMMASQTKAHLSEVGQFVTRTATEVHGGMGFTDLVGLHYWFKRAGFNRQMLGSPEQHRERAFQALFQGRGQAA